MLVSVKHVILRTGPKKVAPAKPAVAAPLPLASQKSTYVPPTMAIGAAPKQPARNRDSMIVVRFWATASGIWKIMKMANPKKRGLVRP